MGVIEDLIITSTDRHNSQEDEGYYPHLINQEETSLSLRDLELLRTKICKA